MKVPATRAGLLMMVGLFVAAGGCDRGQGLDHRDAQQHVQSDAGDTERFEEVDASQVGITEAECDARRQSAWEQLDATFEMHRSCEQHIDCIQASNETGCGGGCLRAVTSDGAEAVQATITEIKEGVCHNYREDGCQLILPGCYPSAAFCVQGVCEESYAPCEVAADPLQLAGMRWTFGECEGDCAFELEWQASGAADAALPLDACGGIALHICDASGETCRQQLGRLSVDGHRELRIALQALEGETLGASYGCPDCADGGAATLTLERDGQASEHGYEYRAAPEVLQQLDEILQLVFDGLRNCEHNAVLEVDASCQISSSSIALR